jgi:hypothetical protein
MNIFPIAIKDQLMNVEKKIDDNIQFKNKFVIL